MKKQDEEISFATSKKNMLKFKLVFVGDQAVGKSSIINRFIKDQFDPNHNPTVGIDFVSKNLNIGGAAVRLQLWDTAGQQRFRSLIPGYLRDCQAAFIVFDITERETFDSIDRWIDFVKEARGEDALICVIGNKSDLAESRCVSSEEVMESKIKNSQCKYYEVSAKTGENLQKVFKDVCADLLNITENSQSLNLEMQKSKVPNFGKTVEGDRPITSNRKGSVESTGQELNPKMGGTKLQNPGSNSEQNPRRIKQKNCC